MHTTSTAKIDPYTQNPDGSDRTAGEVLAIESLREDLVSGRMFDRFAASSFSVYGYQPPIASRDWSHAVSTIGRMAGESDALAQVALSILATIPNLYGTPSSVAGGIYSRAADAMRSGFDDVLARSGPEPVRYSDAQRPFSLRQAALVALWLLEATGPFEPPNIGWALRAVLDAEGIPVTPDTFGWRYVKAPVR